MVNLNAAEPHFIRCLKPNSAKASHNWDPELVTKQLRYTGMLETTRIRREGFALRPTFEDFSERFGPLAISYGLPLTPTEAGCRAIMEQTGLTDWQVGKTKIFLRYYHADNLTELQRPVQNAATTLQKSLRGHIARKHVGRLQAAKTEQQKKVDSFASSMERNGSAVCDVFAACCEEDDKRPRDFWEPKQASEPKVALYEGEVPAPSGKKKRGVGRRQSVKWVEEQKDKGECNGDGVGGFAEWFAGVMSRGDSENILKNEPVGTFLIRVSETRFGYSLSATGSSRIKHFMVDQVKDTSKYIVVGNARKFDSLDELIEHHKKHPLTDDGFKLSTPIKQSTVNLEEFIK